VPNNNISGRPVSGFIFPINRGNRKFYDFFSSKKETTNILGTMKTITTYSFRSIIVLALILLSSQLYGQFREHRAMGHQGGAGYREMRRESIPGLTEDQKQKIEKFNLAFDRNTLQKHNQIAEKEAQLQTAVTQPAVNLDQTDKLINEISSLRAEIRKERVRTDAQIREVLNEDQRLVFDKMRVYRPGYRFGRS
jgi:Spy/CpxP family protein refolding chaperone